MHNAERDVVSLDASKAPLGLSNGPTELRFKAFMSYSHAADGRLAPELQHALQAFTKPWYARRACRIFRDKTTLAVTAGLWPAIERALRDSEFFLLLASPAAAASPWVSREVEWWCRSRPVDHLLLVLTEGSIAWDDEASDFDWSQTTALPSCLSRQFAAEPLFVDMRWAREEGQLSLRHPPFLESVAELASALSGLDKDELIGREVREHRRTRRITRAVVTALTLLTLATGTLWLRADRALKLAESRRQQARGVAETIAFDVNNSLLGVPEASEARKTLNERAKTLLEALGGSADDFRVTRATMVLHGQRGDDAAARGDLNQARAELMESLRLAKQLSAQQPMNGEFLRDVAACLSKLGDIARASHDVILAREYVEQDLALTRQLLLREPDSLVRRQDLSISLEKLGNICLDQRDVSCARAALEEDLKIMEELHAQYATNKDVTKGLAVALVQTGEMRFQTGRQREAATAFTQAVALNRTLQETAPQDSRVSRDLSVSLLKLGDVEIQQRTPGDALPRFEEALAIRRSSLRRNPDDPAAIRDVAVVLGRVASAHLQLDRPLDGLPSMSEAIALYERLAQLSPGDAAIKRELAINLYDLAGAEARLDDFQKARDHLARSVALLRESTVQSPLSGPGQELFQTLRRAGLVELELRDIASAASLHAEACALSRTAPDATGDAEAVELILDLHQIAGAHLNSRTGDASTGTACATEATRRLELLHSSNLQAWEGAELREIARDLNDWAAQPKAAL